jgi:hypothetical protein
VKPSQRHARWATALVAPLITSVLCIFPLSLAAQTCELVLTEHRSGKFLVRLPINPIRPAADVAFTHSVLGTPVLDRYVWRPGPQGWRAHLVEERFEGEGYGLPSSAAQGETLERFGSGSKLTLDRVVDPLVVLPLPAQSMRLVLSEQREILFGQLSQKSIEIRAKNCHFIR